MNHIAIVGITTAYALLERGYDVTIFDRNRYAAMQTSFANGGQLSASNAEVWTQTSTIIKGLKWMFNKDAPLLVNPKPSWHKLSWMAEFMSNIPNYEANTIETVKLAIAAREHLYRWAEVENIDFDLEHRGILHMYTNRKGYDHGERVNRLLKAGGLDRRAVSADEMKDIEPALTGEYYGGFFTESDATGDIHKYSRGLADACRKRGAKFRYEADVVSINTNSGNTEPRITIDFTQSGSANTTQKDFDGVVVCAGVRSREFAAELGDRVNIYPVKGYSITVPLNDEKSISAAPWASLLDDDAKIVTSRLGEDRFRIAGTAEFNGMNLDIRRDRIDPLVAWCRQHFPDVSTDQVIPWAGLRPMMPNMMPRVGTGSQPGVFYNTGHGHLGWTLSAATAEVIGDVVSNAMPRQSAHAIAA